MTSNSVATPSQVDELIDGTVAFINQAPQARTAFSAGLMLYRLQAAGQPQTVDRLAAATGQPVGEITMLLSSVLGLHIDDDGSVSDDPETSGLLPRCRVRMLDTGHETELAGCVVDALFLPALTGRPARIDATCPVTGRPASIQIRAGRAAEVDPPEAVISLVVPNCDPADLISSVCPYGHVFASAGAAASWRTEHPQAALLPPADALRYATAIVNELVAGTAGRAAPPV